tara:strand:+ start:243 stop:425 length:183 start_codon:yes stop_codon:yes gene_type:complete
MDKSKKGIDWVRVEQCAAAILVSAKCTDYSETYDPTKKVLTDARILANALGYKLVKRTSK